MLIKPDVQKFAKIRTFSFALMRDYNAHIEEPFIFDEVKKVKVVGGLTIC
jgi:hypothetical protein